MKKTHRSLFAILACLLALVFSVGVLGACGNEAAKGDETESAAWYYGEAIPSDSLGKDGDYYLDTTTLSSYVKEGSAWRLAETGETGKLYYGSDAPQADLGDVNDLYLDMSTSDLYRKTEEGWGDAVLTLKGEKGDKGRDGVIWFSGKGEPKGAPEAYPASLEDALSGDFYIDTETWKVYQLVEDGAAGKSNWLELGTILGKAGTLWFHGKETPEENASAALAAVGDYYMRHFDPVNGYTGYQIYVKETESWKMIVNNDVCHVMGHAFGEGNICPNCGLENVFADSKYHEETETGEYLIKKGPTGKADVVIPGNVNGKPVKLQAGAFASLKNIKTVTFDEGVTEFPDGTSSTNGMFAGCTTLESVTLPESLKKIGNYAFHGCSQLKSVNIPENVETIGKDAFYNCKNLNSIIVPNSVISLGERAFGLCDKLKSVTLGSGVTEIGSNMFTNCYALADITIKGNVISIGEQAFYHCDALTSFTVPDTVTQIGDRAFRQCVGLQNVTIGAAVETISTYAFQNCSALKTVNFKCTNLTTIMDGVFDACPVLEQVQLPSTLTAIGKYAFRNCRELTEITTPEGVTKINQSLFSGCAKLSHVTILGAVTQIDGAAFKNCTALTGITFGGTIEEFDALLSKANFLSSCESVTVTCDGGTCTYANGVKQ